MRKLAVKLFKEKSSFLWLVLILVLGFALRFYRLESIPPSLFGDEVDVGYQAYSILRTGRDYSGNPWPINFQSLADWRTPLFLYATVPFVWLFGLTEWGVRLAPALFGVFTIPLFYLLVKELFKSEKIGLLAALFLAISPWHLQYSRAAFEVTQMLFLLLLGVWFFLRGLKISRYLLLAAPFLALAPYSYNTAKLFVPLLVVFLVVVFLKDLKRLKKKDLILAALIFVLVSLPLIKDIIWGEGGSRFSILAIFTDPTVIPQIGFDRLVDARVKLGEVPVGFTPSFSSRFFHNKFLAWGTTFLVNYFQAFSTRFLFTFGDINFRHSIQGNFGELYWLDALFLCLGVYWLLTKTKERNLKLFLLGWLLLAPVPSALTRDGGNHATRLILMLPPLLILVSLGVFSLFNYLKEQKKKILVAFLLLASYSLLLVLYLHRYYIHWPLESERWWHPGFKQAGEYVLQHEGEYDRIVWSTRGEPPLIFFLFWTHFPPEEFQKAEFKDVLLNGTIESRHLLGTKFYFGALNGKYAENYNFKGALDPKTLYIMPEGEIHTNLKKTPLPPGLKLLKIIDLPSGEPGMYLVSGV